MQYKAGRVRYSMADKHTTDILFGGAKGISKSYTGAKLIFRRCFDIS